MIERGDKVRVYPHGSPKLATTAEVLIISDNQRAIAVAFGDAPPFVTSKAGVAIHPEHGVVLLAKREILNGKPWGPWVETFGGGHYEIEEATS